MLRGGISATKSETDKRQTRDRHETDKRQIGHRQEMEKRQTRHTPEETDKRDPRLFPVWSRLDCTRFWRKSQLDNPDSLRMASG